LGGVVQEFFLTSWAEDDAELARRLKSRDPHALGELYDRYGRLVYFLIHRLVADTSAAEDMVQETFLKVWNSIYSFEPARGPLGRWVVSVARNRAIDYLRSWEGRMAQGAFPIQEWDEPSAPGNVESDLMNADRVRALRSAMTRLSGRQQTILNLAYVEGLTQMEMAERLKRPLGTIKTWVRAALQTLRAEMALDSGAQAFPTALSRE
jgi:RNA polymerase sigma-70 factor (ECF subfamily)